MILDLDQTLLVLVTIGAILFNTLLTAIGIVLLVRQQRRK